MKYIFDFGIRKFFSQRPPQIKKIRDFIGLI